MKKCKGCGIELQNTNREGLGYVVDLEQDYCKRCFRLSHYGDLTSFKTNYVTNERILRIYQRYSGALFVLIVDALDGLCLEQDDLLPLFKDFDLLLVINKTDLFPDNISDKKIEKIYSGIIERLNKKYGNIKAAILSNRFENHFNEQFLETINELSYHNIVFAGRANAGKSTLINKLLQNDSLTTSMYPGTTLDEVEISYGDYRFIDTPGLVDVNNYATYLNLEKYKLSRISKMIRPQVFQLNEPQSYFYEGLLRVDILPQDKASVTFYISNDNHIHRTRYENGDDYYQKHYCEFILRVKPLAVSDFSIEEKKLILIKGLGLVKISGRCFASIHAHGKVRLYECEVEL